MPHGETPGQLVASLERARREGLDAICLEAEQKKGLPRGILLAIASRETHCRNVVGDGGHGRGYFQIDDRAHPAFLRKHGALGAGGVPPTREAALYAAQLLLDNGTFGKRSGVKPVDLLKFSLSSYNAGAGNAIKGYRDGDSDRRTAHANYGRDVLERLRIVTAWLDDAPIPRDRPVLCEGSRGKAVLELKRKLAATTEGAPVFAMTPVWGKALTKAVLEFQRANGLDDDAVVGADTWRVLDRVPMRAKAPT